MANRPASNWAQLLCFEKYQRFDTHLKRKWRKPLVTTMIKEFVDAFISSKALLKLKLKDRHPEDYAELVKWVIQIFEGIPNEYDYPNPDKIHKIDDGDYQGTLLFLIPSVTYQPHKYWYVFIHYGSCSGCDTFTAIKDYCDDPPSESQIEDYMTLTLHIVQGLRVMEDKDAEV